METQTNNKAIYIKINNDDFASASRFRKVLLKYQLVFKGNDDALMQVIESMPKVSTSRMIETLGFDTESNTYFFANAALNNGNVLFPNEFGMVEIENLSCFMPYTDNKVGDTAKFKNALRFKYVENKNETFNSWFKLIYKAHKEESIIPVCFTIASMFRDIVFNKLHFCPILYIKGVRGSGKSSLARNLTALFGFTQHEISLKSPNTTKSLPRLLSQLSNSVLWLDEFHNNLSDDIKGMLQSVYDGGGYEKAAFTNGVETTSVTIQSMLMLTSNYIPDDEIFFSRTILIQMNETMKTDEQRKTYKQITELEKSGLSCVAIDIMQHRKLILEQWKQSYEYIFQKLYAWFEDFKIDNRFIENLSGIITPTYILIKNGKIILKDNEPDFHETLIRIAYNVIIAQYKIFYDNNKSLEFWNIVQMLYEQHIIKKDVDLKFVDGTDETNATYLNYYIAIRFGRLYESYRKQIGNKANDKQTILEQLTNHESYCYTKNSVRFLKEDESAFALGQQIEIKDNKKSTVQSAMFFNYKQLKDSIGIDF